MRGSDAFVAVLVLIALVAAAAYLGRPELQLSGAVHVVDGDTLKLGGHTIRLAGMDAPEMAQSCDIGAAPQPCGRMARDAVIRMVAGAAISCRLHGHDRYQRDLGRCAADGRDIGGALVLAGLAVSYGGYRAEEDEARQARRGIWAGTFERPVDWRREHEHNGAPRR